MNKHQFLAFGDALLASTAMSGVKVEVVRMPARLTFKSLRADGRDGAESPASSANGTQADAPARAAA